MTQVEGNLESAVVENGEIMADINDGSISLNLSVESQGETESEEVAVNGINGVCENEENESKVEASKTDSSSYVVSGKTRKSSMERLLEEKLSTTEIYEDGDVFIEQPVSSSSSSRASISSSTSVDDDGAPRQRRTSVYEQKQIEAPSSMKGNVIASRTQNLLKQYQKDLEAPVFKPVIDLTEGAEVSQINDDDGNVDNDTASLERKRELQNIKLQYQQRILQEEKEKAEERSRRLSENDEVKSRKPLGSHMNRYIALTKGESIQHSSDEDDEQDGSGNNSLYIDKHGGKIERSGGKIEIVKSSDSISSIKNRFGESTQWKKMVEVETPTDEVDPTKVKSAMSVFKEIEVKKQEPSLFNRPKSKKVRDPKEVMELRKKATYGDEEELPQDGVVTKTVVIEREELDTTIKHHALNVYKNLEKRDDSRGPLHKPKTKLLSDVEAQATMEGIRTISSSASEASDINETTNDLTVDTVSGYGSAAPCSPSSTLSEDYLSDHKDESPREKLKDSSVIICEKDSTLNLEVTTELNIDDDPLVKCPPEISSEVACENNVEAVVGVV